MSKIRDKPGSIENMFLIGDVNEKNVLVVDDIFDSGGSGIKAGKLLKEHGAKELIFYATHGLFTKGTKEYSECIIML